VKKKLGTLSERQRLSNIGVHEVQLDILKMEQLEAACAQSSVRRSRKEALLERMQEVHTERMREHNNLLRSYIETSEALLREVLYSLSLFLSLSLSLSLSVSLTHKLFDKVITIGKPIFGKVFPSSQFVASNIRSSCLGHLRFLEVCQRA